MYNNVEEEILKLAKDIFNKQDTRLVNFALQDVYTTITGKQKYVKTELDLIIVLYQLWSNNGKKEVTMNSSVNVTTAELNDRLGVAKSVSSTLANLKKYSVHEKKVFALDENGNKFKVGKSYAREYITVTPEVILFDITVKDDFVRNNDGEIVGRTTVYTIKPTSVLVGRLNELGLNDCESTETLTSEVVEENVQEVPSTVEMEVVSEDNTSNDLDYDFDYPDFDPEANTVKVTFVQSDNMGEHGPKRADKRTHTETKPKSSNINDPRRNRLSESFGNQEEVSDDFDFEDEFNLTVEQARAIRKQEIQQGRNRETGFGFKGNLPVNRHLLKRN